MAFSTKIFASPGRYVQGAGAIHELGAHISILGSRVLVVGGKTGLAATAAGRAASFAQYGITQQEALFGGETSDSEIDRLVRLARENLCDVLLASGGGKAIDAVKAAAEDLDVPAVIIPSVASNDAPCSALSVIYNEDGTFNRLRPLKKSPSLVLLDTELLVQAPVRTLVAGMGDALATWFEAEACYKSGALNNFGGHISRTALTLARLCLDTLLEFGPDAKGDCAAGCVTDAFEHIVEANTLLSGLGFESGGVAVAHALSESFSLVPEMHHALHGEKVAFGVLVQLILDKQPETELQRIAAFCHSVGLPVTLAALGWSQPDPAQLRQIAADAAQPGKPAHNMPFTVTTSQLLSAITAADTLGRQLG